MTCATFVIIGVFFQQLHVLGRYYYKSILVAVTFYSIKNFVLLQHKHNKLCQVTRFSAPDFKFESRPGIKSNCPLLTLHIALKPTLEGDTLDSAEQFRACKVSFKTRMGMHAEFRHLQHCMGMSLSSAGKSLCMFLQSLAHTSKYKLYLILVLMVQDNES